MLNINEMTYISEEISKYNRNINEHGWKYPKRMNTSSTIRHIGNQVMSLIK